jgi:hypothetical protein
MPYEIDDDPQPRARAYVYAGDWVADCPRPGSEPGRPGCANVEFLYTPSRMNGPRDVERPFFHCSHCGFQAGISWPRRREAIDMVLGLRPVPQNRNWYPTDHPVALRFHLPHGQSLADLMAENEQHGVSNEPLKGLV